MKKAHEGIPVHNLRECSADIVFAKIDSDTGLFSASHHAPR